VQWVSLLVVVAAACALGLRWNNIPERWTIHWGIGGQPEGWANRNFWNVFWPLMLGAAIWTALELIAAKVKRGGGDTHATRRMLSLLRIVQLAPTISLAATSVWLPLGTPASPLPLVGFTLVLLASTIALEVARLGTPARRAGLLHRDPNDDRLWVPSKLGWALNFGHPEARRTATVLLLPPIFILIAVVFCLWAARR
jgi:hypothetical protein